LTSVAIDAAGGSDKIREIVAGALAADVPRGFAELASQAISELTGQRTGQRTGRPTGDAGP
jgi:hypothetical protein